MGYGFKDIPASRLRDLDKYFSEIANSGRLDAALIGGINKQREIIRNAADMVVRGEKLPEELEILLRGFANMNEFDLFDPRAGIPYVKKTWWKAIFS